MNLKFVRLSDVDPVDIVALHNDPDVLRHMPLANGVFDRRACDRWVEDKEASWGEYGYGPWAILIDGVFAGWGGLQPEMGDADISLVLSPGYWGCGSVIFRKIIELAFGEMRLESVTALLPLSRSCADGMRRLGFQSDGQVEISGSSFNRYRLWSPAQTPSG